MKTREELEARAKELRINFKANWKDDTLAAKIAEAEKAEDGSKGSSQGNQNQTTAGAKTPPAPKPAKGSEKKVEAVVVDHLDRDGKPYKPGDPISLPRKVFDRLKQLKVVKAAE